MHVQDKIHPTPSEANWWAVEGGDKLDVIQTMDIQYAQSCILTPCDFPFARGGIAADSTPNVEAVAIADLSLAALREVRQSGTVRNLRDRRLDLYQVRWLPPA